MAGGLRHRLRRVPRGVVGGCARHSHTLSARGDRTHTARKRYVVRRKPGGAASAIQPAVTPQANGYSSDYTDRPFEMPGDACQYSNTDNASNVSFTRQTANVTVTDNNDGDMDINCNGLAETATLLFNDQVAQVTGNPSPSECAAAITTKPISDSIDFGQLQQGEEFCFIAGYPNGAKGPLVFVKLTSVAGTPTFITTWAATAWQIPSSS